MQPCEMLRNYLFFEDEGGTLAGFLSQYDFDCMQDICKAVRDFVRTVYGDRFMRGKKLAEMNPAAAALFARCRKIVEDPSKFDKFHMVMGSEIWHGGYCRKRLNERTATIMREPANEKRFMAVCERVKKVYGLSDLDIEKIRFFVEQVKAGDMFPDSLRRMLYVWGMEKKTGKTTTAKIIVSLLNGETDLENVSQYDTTLANEMQIKGFAVPKISECNACIMDECFYADMGKTYADFKRFLTSSNGRARLPYGQEFNWYGHPNYIATSNDPLKVFIKDWGDRRYLSVEFKARPAVKMTETELIAMWREFIVNSTPLAGWQEWSDKIAPAAEEIGERQEITNEYAMELSKSAFLKQILDMPTPPTKFCKDNQITCKFFVDYFATSVGNMEAHKRRKEIEAAALQVFGARYSSTNYWLLTGLKEVAQRLYNDMYTEGEEPEEKIDLLF